ncbi:MAG TPA: hypothetical protein VJU61_29255 [Polyangiaceae bacterium]|nr:hypothetical protein [Polyangiaceae bacterium]
MVGEKKKRAAQRVAPATRVRANKASVERKSAVKKPRAQPSRAGSRLRALPELDPFAELPPQPEWVMRDFPEYAEGSHVSGPVSSRRVSYAGGHEIEITTTYAVTIDGQPAPMHMLVDSDGRLWSHLCPYVTFANANELIAHIIEHAPEALTDIHAGHGGAGHGGTGHRGHGGAEA